MKKIINSNCKRCPDFEKKNCMGDLSDCLCRFCPRNIGLCIRVRWCRETESPMDNLCEIE
ncbi:hypothetical protein [Clostridium cylindrosporum]|uniref:Uncharacterized protein n=1 Tax=Clostridium cylindrosporum DSM 605 TaxID=1121307 RepID=A0A0J8D9B5_CLOCY|nr:hypothetical protein [Clostridium cylindrosporum]KMT20878.1 hypothetical protein CLCY_1c01120 [Clostridium cylindrosporum DSM 605]